MKFESGKILEDRSSLIERVKSALSKHEDIIFAYIFGGVAKGRITPLSDIDIAVYLKDVENIDLWEKKVQILKDLEEELKTEEIDLVVLNEAPISLKGRIMQNKILIIDRDKSFRCSFESLTLKEFFDFSILEREILYRRYKIDR